MCTTKDINIRSMVSLKAKFIDTKTIREFQFVKEKDNFHLWGYKWVRVVRRLLWKKWLY